MVVGSNTTSTYALTIDGFPADCELSVINYGYIVGAGGDAGGGGTGYCQPGHPGQPGGPAIYVRYPTTIVNNGVIGSGGGGGSGGSGSGDYYGYIAPGGSGGGGAGSKPGQSLVGPYVGSPGTLTKGGKGHTGATTPGGNGGTGGPGGDLGNPSGIAFNSWLVSPTTVAINGISYVTLTGAPPLGPVI